MNGIIASNCPSANESSFSTGVLPILSGYAEGRGSVIIREALLKQAQQSVKGGEYA